MEGLDGFGADGYNVFRNNDDRRQNILKRYFAVLFILALCITILALPASGASGTTGGAVSPTKEELRAKWATVTDASTVYETEPSITAPYAAGALTEDYLQSGITYLNFIRYVAGLPEVPLDDNLNDLAQHAAVVMAANDTMSHYPSKPAGMDDSFFQKGYEAAGDANLSAFYGAYKPLTMLQKAVQSFMDDNGPYNVPTVGHRRWVLNPTLGKVGFGFAEAEYSGYVVNHIHDTSGKAVDYDFISWPVAGNMPNELFNPTVPWSVTLNPAKYKAPVLEDLYITVTNETTGEVWTFDKNTGKPYNAQEAFLTVDTQGYGVFNCIIFTPGAENIGDYMGLYTVKITGLKTAAGKATTLTYQVDFFDMEECQHSFIGVSRPSTCWEAGLTFKRCTICGYETDKRPLPLAGHTWEAESCLELPVCLRCGAVGDEPYFYSHKYTTQRVDPTCTTTGYDTHTCSVCGDTYTDNEKPMREHDYDVTITQATCTEDGVAVYECEYCGDTYSTAYGDAKGHIYDGMYANDANGHWLHCRRCGEATELESHVPGPAATDRSDQICTVCRYVINPAGADAGKFKIAFANMTLGNSLAMNFAFEQGHRTDWTGCYATIVKEYADGRADKVVTIPYAQWGSANINGVMHYTLKFDGVAAKEMSDVVYVTVYDKNGNAVSKVWVDSVRSYATRTLQNPATSEESAIMIVDLLNYGAAAQNYFGYNTGNLANKQLSDLQKALATKDAPATDIRVKGANYKGTNLGLESQILMRMAFGGTNTSMYAVIEFTNHSGNKVKVNVSGSEFGASGVIVIDEIVIADGRKPVTVTVYNADGTVFASATDSMESYIARMRVDKYDPLYEAILKFSDSAYNFFH